MKMKLFQFEGMAVNSDGTAPAIVHLNRMTVMEYLLCPRFVIDLKRREIGLDEVRKIDRGLVLPLRAGPELRIHFAPVFRPSMTGVAPMVTPLLCKCPRGKQKYHAQNHNYLPDHFHFFPFDKLDLVLRLSRYYTESFFSGQSRGWSDKKKGSRKRRWISADKKSVGEKTLNALLYCT
jgi:hypothetical protein